MIYRGTVRGGVVVLPPDGHLPDGQGVTRPAGRTTIDETLPASWQNAMRRCAGVFPPASVRNAPDLHLVNQLRDETKL